MYFRDSLHMGSHRLIPFLVPALSPTWSSIQETHKAPPAELFRHLQLRHWITSLRHHDTFPTKRLPSKHICLHCPGAPGTISVIYSSLHANSTSTFISDMLIWERDWSHIDLADWSKAWSSIVKCSFNTATVEAAYKVLR